MYCAGQRLAGVMLQSAPWLVWMWRLESVGVMLSEVNNITVQQVEEKIYELWLTTSAASAAVVCPAPVHRLVMHQQVGVCAVHLIRDR